MSRLDSVFTGRRSENRLNAEIEEHIALQTQENVRAGMSPSEARRQAFLKFGPTEAIKESYRDQEGLPILETTVRDMKYAIRVLRKSPGFTAIAVITLALGIGLNSAIFSAVYAILLNPLPYPRADRLVMTWERVNLPSYKSERNDPTPGDFSDWKQENTVFQDMAAVRYRSFAVTDTGEPQQVEGEAVSSSMFSVLQATPALGRTFTEQEDRSHARVAVIANDLWASRFGSNPAVVGQTITLDGEGYVVIGVMAPGFHFPDPDDRIWVPISFPEAELANRGSHYLRIVARLKPNTTVEQAEAQLQTVAAHMTERYPKTNTGESVNLVPLREDVTGSIRKPLLVLLGAAGLVLLIMCANIANMLLARASGRQGEIAIRLALGASRSQIIRQVLTESLLLAILGGAAGITLASWVASAMRLLSPLSIPRIDEVRIQTPVLLFTVAASLLTGCLFGLAPALSSARPIVQDALCRSRLERGGNRFFSLRNLLVIAQTALGVIVIVAAGLLVRSFVRMQSTTLGFEPAHMLTMRVIPRGEKYHSLDQRTMFYQQAIERIEAIGGVRSAAAVAFIPLMLARESKRFTIEGQAPRELGQLPVVGYEVVSPRYFQTIETPLIVGRDFAWSDTMRTQRVVLINQTMARTYWPHQDPTGKRVKEGPLDSPDPWLTIVGVVGDIRQYNVSSPPLPTVYFPATQFESATGGVLRDWVIRTTSDPGSMVALVQDAIWSLDPALPISRVQSMEHVRTASMVPQRFSVYLFGSFGILAVFLAGVGLYGVMSYAVSRRTHEIGIRMALGAHRRDVGWLVMCRSLTLTATGLIVGTLGSLLSSKLLAGMLYEVRPADVVTYSAALALLTIVATVASYVPALRAANVDPMVALRAE